MDVHAWLASGRRVGVIVVEKMVSDLPGRLRKRAVKLRWGTNDQHTPGLLDEAAAEIERLAVDIPRAHDKPNR